MHLFFFFILSLFFQPVLAQESTTTPVPSKDLTEEVRDMVTQKVKEIQQNSSGEVLNSTTIPKSLIGTVTQIQDKKITISYKNSNQEINIDDDTVFINEKKVKTKIDNLKLGQVILAMGYYNDSNNFGAKRIIFTTNDEIENKNETVLGTIADISQTSNILVLIPIKNKNIQYQIKVDSQTKIINKDNTPLTLSKIKSGQKVIIIIQPDTKISNTFDASQIITLDSDQNPTPTSKK